MEDVVLKSKEEAIQRMNSGDSKQDLEFVNSILSGNVKIESEDTSSTEDVVETVENTENDTPQTENDTNEDEKDSSTEESVEIEIDPLKDEYEREKRYTDFLKKRSQEDKEEYLKKIREIEQEKENEQKAKEELEQRLQKLVESTNKEFSTEKDESDEDEFVSDYTKKTRNMVEELRDRIKNNSSEVTVEELSKKLEQLQNEIENERKERDAFKEKEKKRKYREQLFSNIRSFYAKHPEMCPSEDIEKIHDNYSQFRKDMVAITGVQSIPELEKAIKNYFNDGEIKELADKHGIRPVKDYDKYIQTVELLDFADGKKFNPSTGDYDLITDENGNRVRYKSLDEAFIVKNYYTSVTDAKRQAYKDVDKKLKTFKKAAVTLNPEKTDGFISNKLTFEEEKEVLSWSPKEWINDPNRRDLVAQVYAKRGLDMPKYRGK